MTASRTRRPGVGEAQTGKPLQSSKVVGRVPALRTRGPDGTRIRTGEPGRYGPVREGADRGNCPEAPGKWPLKQRLGGVTYSP